MSDGPPELSDAERQALAPFNVSRETLARLELYWQLLLKWQRTINLVSPSTLAQAWQRHFIDSAQLLPHLPDRGTTMDLGSGAGFPGMVLAIATGSPTHLVESDLRKAAFLRTVARLTETSNASIHAARIEAATLPPADVITARALAPLTNLLAMAEPFTRKNTILIFPKGKSLHQELTVAKQQWHMRYDILPSCTDRRGQILRIFEAQRDRSG